MNFTIFIPIYCFGHQTDIPTGQYLNDWMFSSGSLGEFLYSHVWIEVFTPAKVLAKWRWYLVEGWQNIHWWIFSFFSVSLVSYANPTFLFVTHYKNKMLTKYWFHWYKRNYITTLATCRIPRSRVYQTSIRVAINCNRNCARQFSFFFSKILFRLRLDVQENRLLPFVKVTNYNVPKEVCCWCLIIDLWLYHQSRNDISESPSERSQILAQDVPISGSAQLLKHLSGS